MITIWMGKQFTLQDAQDANVAQMLREVQELLQEIEADSKTRKAVLAVTPPPGKAN